MQVSCNDDQFGTKHWSNTLGANGATFALTGNAGAASNSTFSQKPGGAFFNTGFLLQAPTVQATIRALIQRGKLKSINSPVTYTKTGEPVQIRSVQYQTIFMQTGAAATTPYNFTTGLTIDVVPRILGGGTIDLKINPALSAQTGTSPAQSVSNPAVPIISTVAAAAHVRIRSGEAAVIGGIAPLTDNDSKDGVPGVRNNSLLGYLLQSRQKMIARTNLVIIVSPKIVKRAPFKRDDRVGADQAGMVQNLTDLPLVDAKANRTIYIQQAKPEKPAATGQLH
jgi:type II secretory pathway component GspD/PulD (secretin)